MWLLQSTFLCFKLAPVIVNIRLCLCLCFCLCQPPQTPVIGSHHNNSLSSAPILARTKKLAAAPCRSTFAKRKTKTRIRRAELNREKGKSGRKHETYRQGEKTIVRDRHAVKIRRICSACPANLITRYVVLPYKIAFWHQCRPVSTYVQLPRPNTTNQWHPGDTENAERIHRLLPTHLTSRGARCATHASSQMWSLHPVPWLCGLLNSAGAI